MKPNFYCMTMGMLLLCFGLAQAQDIHLAHIHASPTYLNPALTGLFHNGNIRFIGNARSQWETVTKGYKTIAGSVDMKMADLGGNSLLGTGLQLTSDKAGDLDFTKTSVSLTLSILKALDREGKQFVMFGMRGSYYNYRLDYTKMVGFDIEPMVLDGAPDNLSFWDVSAGAAWHYSFSRFSSFYLGGALFHLNMPNTSFFSKMYDEFNTSPYYQTDQLYRKLVIHGGGDFRMAKYITALPSFIFLDQGPHREINFGTFVKFFKSRSMRKSPYAFYLGMWFRSYLETDIAGFDAIISAVRMDIRNTFITFSFDTNLSTLTRASNGFGGPELSIIQIIGNPRSINKVSKVKCPAF